MPERDKLLLHRFAQFMSSKKGKLYVVGVGPGSHDHMTYRAKQVIEESEVIVGL